MLDSIFGGNGKANSLDLRFSEMIPLGCGSSGLIVSALDKKLGKRVALKKLTFTDVQLCKQGLREIRIIRRLQHANIIRVYEIVDSHGSNLTLDVQHNILTQMGYVYLVEEVLDTDLAHLIKERHLTDGHRKWFLFQLLLGLRYLHSANVIHRDLTPSNLLIDCNDLTLKIADFGLSRVLDPNYIHKGYLTERVGHCWYRSPEQMMHGKDYDHAVDIWSAGCVFAEMILCKPLFPGSNEFDQVRQILDAIYLDEDDWGVVLKVVPNKLLKNHPFRPRVPLGSRFLTIDPQALDLMEKMLSFSSSKRMTASDAIRHPFFSEFNDQRAEQVAVRPLQIEHEVDQLSPTTLRRKIVQESCGESVSCGVVTPPASSPLPPSNSPQPPSEHTLEEILDLQEDANVRNSKKNASVEDLNKKNLKNSQENLSQGQQPNGSCNELHTDSNQRDVKVAKPKLSRSPADDPLPRLPSNEKEEADVSEEKARQDEELSRDAVVTEEQGPNTAEEEPVIDLTVDNNKEETETPPPPVDTDTHDDPEWKLLQFEQELEYAKFETDTTENEKSHLRKSNSRRRGNRTGAPGNPPRLSEDLDERYRLPTEHLRMDRDYSNERIRHKTLTAQYRHIKALYQEIQNERRRDEGAVGGPEDDVTDLLHRNPNERDWPVSMTTRQGAAHYSPPVEDVYSPLLIRTDLHPLHHTPNYHSSRLAERHLQANADCPSPDEAPVSPRSSYSVAGARPKKSSKNNRK